MQAQHHRFAIWNAQQHPYKHKLSEFNYLNDALPGITNLESALNWILAVLYPQTQDAVANVAALPSVGNTINDYRVVLDDGDGKAASYRWEQREGEASASWHKIYDMDWGADAILEQYMTQTQHLYLFKDGKEDLDETGAAITGVYAGQRVFGGRLANSSLTLSANAGDGVGSQTGYVQTTDHVRPTSNNDLDLGVASYNFRTGRFATSVIVGTLTVSAASITDSSGAISFDNENLSTTGNMTGAVVTGNTSLVSGTLTVVGGSITDSTGAISFSNENLTTTGTLASGTITVTSDLILASGSITSVSGAISFGDENLSTTGNMTGAVVTANTRFVTGAISITGAGTIITSTGADLNFTATGGFGIVFNAAMYGTSGEFTGALKAGTIFEANASMYMSGTTNTIATYAADITLSPSTAILKVNAEIRPTSDNTRDLGTTTLRWNDIFLGGSIGDGTTTISSATLQSLREINTGVSSGMSLFYDGAKWVASTPDTEIAHGSISGLTTSDAGHTQFAMLAGRSGGQTIQGGTAGGEHLLLESTANASKGLVKTKDDLVPNTNAAFTSSWAGTNLGGASNYFNDLYMKGEAKGFRFENFSTAGLPGFSAQNIGRVMWDTTASVVKVDTGAALKTLVDTNTTQTLSGKTFSDATVFSTSVQPTVLKDNSGNNMIVSSSRWIYDGGGGVIVDFNDTYWAVFRGVRYWAQDVSGSIVFRAPLTGVTDHTLYLPPAQGAANTTMVNNGSGTLSWSTLGIASGGTNNPSLAVTAGGVVYTDGSKLVNVGAGSAGQVLTSAGASAPTWATAGSPSGSVIAYAGSAAPTGWLLCYGQAISRTTYADLFTAISTTYGVGDGSTTFNVPDMRGRLAAGKDDMGGSAANRITSGGSGITGTGLGNSGGSETHTLTTAQLSSHNHTQDAHGHSVAITSFANEGGTSNGYRASNSPGDTSVAGAISVTATNQTAGSGSAHNNTQPTIILNYIIKT